MSSALQPFDIGDKVVALQSSASYPYLDGCLVKDVVYTVRDWHMGNTATDDGTVFCGQMVNVVGIKGELRPQHHPGGVPVEYGWFHPWFKRVWTQTETVAVTRAQEVHA